MEEKIAKMQIELDEQYKKEGLTNRVLEKQIKINTLRNEHNIPDTQELTYKGYVQ